MRKHISFNLNHLSWRPWIVAFGLALSCANAAADSDSAFDWGLSYTNESVSILDGGKSGGSGSGYADQLYIGGKVDLEKLWGWSGTQVSIDVSNRSGENVAEKNVGNSTSLQEIYGGQGLRLANFTLKKTWADGRFMWEGGRSVANIHFLGSDMCQYFQLNAGCGNPTFVFRTSSFTWWPVSSWAMHSQVWFTPQTYFHLGTYEVNPTLAEDGKNGTQWGMDNSTGWEIPFAFGYKRHQNSEPGFYELGGWYDSANYSDPLNDENGRPALVSGESYAQHENRFAMFVRFQQNLTSTDNSKGLIAFGAYLRKVSGELEQDDFIKLGLVQRGTFTSRPQDTLAFMYTRQNYSDKNLKNLRLARAAAGGQGTPASSQTMMELSYGIQVTPNLRVQPNLQYIIDPDQINEPARLEPLDDTFAVGLRIDWNIKNDLLKLGGFN